MADLADELITQCPYDPEPVIVKSFDFSPHLPGNKKKPKKEKKEKKEIKDVQEDQDDIDPNRDVGSSLPKRLLLTAFSSQVGHRPMGLQVAPGEDVRVSHLRQLGSAFHVLL
jgi:hypothetical protein